MRNPLNYFFVLFYLTVSILRLCAQQDYEARGFSEKDGPCTSGLNALVADDDGFVWMSSENGVNRFDGSTFYCFKHDESDPFSLLANKCDFVFKDKKGQIWIKSLYGLSLYNKETQRFQNFVAEPGIFSGIAGGKIAEDNSGKLWLGGYGDVVVFNPTTGEFRKSGWYDYIKKSGIAKQEKRNNAVLEIRRKNDHELYLLSVYGLFSVDTRNGIYTYHANKHIDDYWAFYLSHIDDEGKIWIGTYDQCFYIFNPKDGNWLHKACNTYYGNAITDIMPIGRDSLLMLSDKNLLLFRPSLSTFTPINFEFSGQLVGASTGSFWKVCTSDRQLYFLMSGNLPFVQMRMPAAGWKEVKLLLPSGFSNNMSQHTGIAEKILVGDWQRKVVLSYDLKTMQYVYLKDPVGNTKLGTFQYFYKVDDQHGLIVVSDRIYEIDFGSTLVKPLEVASYPHVLQPEFRNVIKDHNGNLFIRERNTGIWLINKNAGRIEPYYSPNIKGNFSDLFYEAATQKFWLSQDRNGVFVIESKSLKSKHYLMQLEERGGPSTINSITGDGKGKIILALLDHGIVAINAASMQLKRYTQGQGLPTDNVNFGHFDNAGNYWGTSQSGLFCLSARNKIRNFEKHRIGSQLFFRLSSDGSGKFYQNLFPSTLLSFDPKILQQVDDAGRFYLVESKVLGERMYGDQLTHLSAHQHSVSFKFGCLQMKDWLQPECEYALNMSKWQSFNLGTELNFFNLSPGQYLLQVRKKGSIMKPFELKFNIQPPWYKTALFGMLATCAVFGLLYFLYNYRINNIRKQEEVKREMTQKMAHMEMAALRAQMNPHFIFNCLNSINRFILTNESDLASDYLTQFSRLIRNVLDNSREEVITLDKEVAALQLYLTMEAMRFNGKFEWKIDVSEDVDVLQWFIAPLTLQPYVENAIWHGLLPLDSEKGVKKLLIHIQSYGIKGIVITIDDNGVGRKASYLQKNETRKSHGMKLTEERMSLVTQLTGVDTKILVIDKTDNKGEAMGTTIKIILSKNEDPLN